jgi:hypothetical protein
LGLSFFPLLGLYFFRRHERAGRHPRLLCLVCCCQLVVSRADYFDELKDQLKVNSHQWGIVGTERCIRVCPDGTHEDGHGVDVAATAGTTARVAVALWNASSAAVATAMSVMAVANACLTCAGR